MPKTDITIRELVDKVHHGELTLPEMQRRYVWPATRVRDLLDSLYRTYPSGTILVWETDEDIEVKELAVAATKAPTTSSRLLLLDGQQRITSLAAILSGQPVHVRHRQKPIEILFNLGHPDGPPVQVDEVDESGLSEYGEDDGAESHDIQEELKRHTFVVASGALKANPLWVPVTHIFKKSDREILKPLGISADDEKWDTYSDRLQRVRKIADYPYVMQVLDRNLKYEEVTEIFVRVNSLGIKLRGTDLAMAQITSRWKGFMRLCEDFAKSFGNDESYILDSGLLVRLLIVFATKQSRFRTVGRLSKTALETAWKRVQPGVEFAVNFIKGNAHVDDLRLLSSPLLLVLIAVYSDLKKQEFSPDEENALLRWFYIAHMRGHYSIGSTESVLDGDLSVLFKCVDLTELLKTLQQRVKQFAVSSADLESRGINNSLFTMLYFVLRQRGAKDWLSGLQLSEAHVGKSHKIEYHHIFPKSLLRDAHYDRKNINEIANMAFISGKANRQILNKPPSQYFPEHIILKRGQEALQSQLISLDPELWKIENYPLFLQARRTAIANEINAFVEALGESAAFAS